MTEQEAIKSLKNIIEHLNLGRAEITAIKLAVTTLEKQIPQRAKEYIENGISYSCPVCSWTERGKLDYCANCGQRLFY